MAAPSPIQTLAPTGWYSPPNGQARVPHGTKHAVDSPTDEGHAGKRLRVGAMSGSAAPSSQNPFELRPLKRSLEDVLDDVAVNPTKKARASYENLEENGLEPEWGVGTLGGMDPEDDVLTEMDADDGPLTNAPIPDRSSFTSSSSSSSSPLPSSSTALILYSPLPGSAPAPKLNPTTGLPMLVNRNLLASLPLPIPKPEEAEPTLDWRSGAGQVVVWTPPEDVVRRAIEDNEQPVSPRRSARNLRGGRKSPDSQSAVDMDLD